MLSEQLSGLSINAPTPAAWLSDSTQGHVFRKSLKSLGLKFVISGILFPEVGGRHSYMKRFTWATVNEMKYGKQLLHSKGWKQIDETGTRRPPERLQQQNQWVVRRLVVIFKIHTADKRDHLSERWLTPISSFLTPTADVWGMCSHLDVKVLFLMWEDSCMLWDIWVDCSSCSRCITVLVSMATTPPAPLPPLPQAGTCRGSWRWWRRNKAGSVNQTQRQSRKKKSFGKLGWKLDLAILLSGLQRHMRREIQI